MGVGICPLKNSMPINVCLKKTKTNRSSVSLLQIALIFFWNRSYFFFKIDLDWLEHTKNWVQLKKREGFNNENN